MSNVYLDNVHIEAERARDKWGPFRSTHEALGVLIEELDELRAAIHANDTDAARHESMQVAAVAYRFYRDGWER